MSKIFIAIPLIVLLVAGYFHFIHSDEPEAPPVVVTSVKEAEPQFLPASELISRYKDANCSTEKWCEAARVSHAQKEGVLILGKTLLVYLNMDAYSNGNLEILALKRIFTSQLLSSFIRQTELNSLQVVAGTIKEDQYSPYIAFKFKRDLDPAKLERFYVIGLFDQALNEHKEHALIDISPLYEKMDL